MSAKEKTKKTAEKTVQTSEQVTERKNVVNNALYVMLQNKRDECTPEQIDELLNTLQPVPQTDKNDKLTGWYNILGGEIDNTLEGITFFLVVPHKETNKKGKIISEKNVRLRFSVSNVIKDTTVFSTGTIAKFSSLKISARYYNTIKAIGIEW